MANGPGGLEANGDVASTRALRGSNIDRTSVRGLHPQWRFRFRIPYYRIDEGNDRYSNPIIEYADRENR